MGHLILGDLVADRILNDIKNEINHFTKLTSFTPLLGVVQIGHRTDSDIYLRAQIRAAHQCGINLKVFYLNSDASLEEISNQINLLNNSPDIHSIIVQLPVMSNKGISVDKILNSIDPNKDADGLSISQAARLSNGDYRHWEKCPFLVHVPCVAAACLLLLQETQSIHPGVRSLVVGRGRLVGLPVSSLLLWSAHATNTICHKCSTSLEEEVRRAEILVAGAGEANLIKGDWIRPGATVIDCGVNVFNEPGRIYGDVEYATALNRVEWITPVPGGVGPLAVALLMRNTLNAAKKSYGIPTHCPLAKPTGVLLEKYGMPRKQSM